MEEEAQHGGRGPHPSALACRWGWELPAPLELCPHARCLGRWAPRSPSTALLYLGLLISSSVTETISFPTIDGRRFTISSVFLNKYKVSGGILDALRSDSVLGFPRVTGPQTCWGFSNHGQSRQHRLPACGGQGAEPAHCGVGWTCRGATVPRPV